MIQRFTEGAKRALQISQDKARAFGHNYVGTEHLLLGLIEEKEGVAAKVLHALGLNAKEVEQEVLEMVGKGSSKGESLYLTPRTKRILELSLAIANGMGHSYIGTEHLLLGLLQDGGGVAISVFENHSIRSEDVVKTMQDIMGSGDVQGRTGKANGEGEGLGEIKDFAQDLNDLVKKGKIDPVVGRDTEINRVIQILSRRTKNNPVLIGEPGVGKTAIAEGLAAKIVEGNVPEILRDKRIISLSLSSMVAGAKYRGEFEERLKKVIEEVQQREDMIVFIDELHTLIGAGAAEGAMDAANILKPALARGSFQVIGATTLDEYKKHIEKDAALERRFQPVLVGEPSEEEALEILEGLRDRYEAFHKVKITDEALRAAVTLSTRYIADRFLPDKAIDVVDEAASMVRLQVFSAPPDVKALEEELAHVRKEKEASIAAQNYENAAILRDKEKSIVEAIEDKQKEWKKDDEEKLIVTEEDIAKVVSGWTGVPVSKLTEEETDRLLHLEDELHKRVIGQEEGVVAVAKAVRRARAGLKDPKRPIGSFLFLGPTGVGKTELARALAETLFNDESAMIRLDMSEYMEKHTVSRLVGAPPGYVGYDEGGQLTDAVRRKPYSVILFDEIEKAHPDFFNILLQVLDDGHLTDNKGRTVDFRNTVIIMTSNLGAKHLQSNKDAAAMGFLAAKKKDDEGDSNYEAAKKLVLDEVKRHFRPEFVNRIDEILVFHALDAAHLSKIVGILLKDVTKRLHQRNMELEVSEAAMKVLVEEGSDFEYGARPLKRALQKRVEDPISELILKGEAKENTIIVVDADEDNDLTFTVRER